MRKDKATYDITSLASIYRYAKDLEGHTLREECDGVSELEDTHKRKGSFGNAIEEFFFDYPINSNPGPDFEQAQTEVKSTPIRVRSDGSYAAKERLFISMINYMSVVDESWGSASLKKKLNRILLIAYQYDKDLNPIDYLVKIVELWGVPKEDLPTFRADWETIVFKVRKGLAHEISGSDTLYLEAATKAASSKVRRPQPFSDIPAKPRAWAIKSSYMTVVLNQMLDMQRIERASGERELDLLTLVRKRFLAYAGKTENELAGLFGYTTRGGRVPKNLCALVTRRILGVEDDAKIAEFEKAGIKAKTIRVKCNGIAKESVSFPAFDYFDVVEKDFEESSFWNYLHQKYLLVIYRESVVKKGEFRLAKVLFWQMPDKDLPEARNCYEVMRGYIRDGHAERSVRSSENRCCHVRPHARNKADTLPTPFGAPEMKKCFWINAAYIGSEIDRVEREENERARMQGAHNKNDGDSVADQTIRVAELFAGVGGFRLGLEGYHDAAFPEFDKPKAGPFKTIWANQWEPPGTPGKQFAAQCYQRRFNDGTLVNEDIHEVLAQYREGRIDIPDIDMVVGGFPCQDYSVAKPLSKANGIEGRKGVLWWDIYEFLQLKDHPRYVLLENVDRLLKSPASQRGRDFAIILSCLSMLRYSVEWRVINGAEYGFPQKRRRTYIYAEQANDAWNIEERLENGVMAEAFPVSVGKMETFELYADPYENTERFGVGLKDSPFKNAGVMQGGRVVTAKVTADYRGDYAVLSDIMVPDEDVPEKYYVPEEQLEKWEYLKGAKKEQRINKRTGFEYVYSEGALPFPDAVDAPARTIITGEGGVGVSRTKHVVRSENGRLRRLVPDELDQLQGFPRGWTNTGMSDNKRAFCAGNALIVGIPHRIGKVIAKRAASE